MNHDLTLAFVGAGNMAGALIRGLIATSTISPARIVAADPDPARRELLASELSIRVEADNSAALENANVVVLSIKPQMFGQVLPTLAVSLPQDALVISIAAGISSKVIERSLPEGTRVIRTMPNTPALVGAGATAIAAGTHATEDDLVLAQTLFECVGTVVRVPETQIDAVTALSGSGPAYVFAMIEALREGGRREGLSEETALQLAAQTVRGAAQLLLEGDESPEALRQKVSSPGGTTLAGLQALDDNGFREALHGAVRAAARRSAELGKIAEGD